MAEMHRDLSFGSIGCTALLTIDPVQSIARELLTSPLMETGAAINSYRAVRHLEMSIGLLIVKWQILTSGAHPAMSWSQSLKSWSSRF